MISGAKVTGAVTATKTAQRRNLLDSQNFSRINPEIKQFFLLKISDNPGIFLEKWFDIGNFRSRISRNETDKSQQVSYQVEVLALFTSGSVLLMKGHV